MYGLYQIVYYTVFDILRTLLSPFFLLVIVVIYSQYSNVSKSPLKATIISILYGIIGGIIATVSFIYLEIYIIPRDFIYILSLSILLSFIDKRFICLSYGGSILVLSNKLIGFPIIDSYEIMILVAILHIVESILILLNGRGQWDINYFKLENRIVGGLVFNRFWPIPFLIFVGDVMIRPISLIAILNYSDYSLSSYPRQKTRETAIILFLYSGLLLLITLISNNSLIAPIFAIVVHELIMQYNKLRERYKTPLYTETLKGIRVLEVDSGSIAHKIGIEQGDVLLRINKTAINDESDLEDIMVIHSHVLTFEYFNLRKGLVRKKYEGQEKTLGIKTFPKVDY